MNCLLTSITTAPPALPTACIPIDPNKYGSIPPINKPTTTNGLDKSNVTIIPSKLEPATLEKCLISSVYAANKTKAPSPADPIA